MRTDLSIWRKFSGWIGKPSMIKTLPLPHYLPDVSPSDLMVGRTSNYRPKSWTQNGIDVPAKVDQAFNLNHRLGLVLLSQLVFGLRVKEALCLKPWKADTCHGLNVYPGDGPKGGRPRFIKLPLPGTEGNHRMDQGAAPLQDTLPGMADYTAWRARHAKKQPEGILPVDGAARDQQGGSRCCRARFALDGHRLHTRNARWDARPDALGPTTGQARPGQRAHGSFPNRDNGSVLRIFQTSQCRRPGSAGNLRWRARVGSGELRVRNWRHGGRSYAPGVTSWRASASCRCVIQLSSKSSREGPSNLPEQR
jgi:hypothetical protein